MIKPDIFSKNLHLKGNAQFVQNVTFEPWMDFKQNQYGSWKILQNRLVLKVFII